MELNVVTVGNGHILVDYLDAIPRHGIDKREHRGDKVGERIGCRHSVGALVDSFDPSLQSDRHALRGFVRRDLFGIVVAYHAAPFDDGIQPGVLGVRELHETVEGRLTPYGVGAETLDISRVLPVVALLQQRETPAADYEVFECHPPVGLMQYGGHHHAAAAAQQLFGKRHDKVEFHTPVALRNRPHFGHDRHLFDPERHHTLAVREGIDRREKKGVAVALQLHDLRTGVRLPLLPLGAGELREMCRRLPAL